MTTARVNISFLIIKFCQFDIYRPKALLFSRNNRDNSGAYAHEKTNHKIYLLEDYNDENPL